MLQIVIPLLASVPMWDAEFLHETLVGMAEGLEVTNATMMWPVRIAVAGKAVTPGGAIELCTILGQDETVRRLKLGLEKLEA